MDFTALNAFIFDLDGVIWRGRTPIEGAVESVAALRAAGKRCFYCTNNSRKTQAEFGAALRGMGIEVQDEEIVTSSSATGLYLQSQFTGCFTAYVVGEEGLVTAIRKAGGVVRTSPPVPERSSMNEAEDPVDCVVAGIDSAFCYHKLRIAQRLIHNGARFIATNRDATFPTERGLVPGAGSIIAAIETASGVTPVTIGKPQPHMTTVLLSKFGLDPQTTVMVGDRLDTDIASAHRAGIAGLFVATGVTPMEKAERARGEEKPDALFADLPAICREVLG